MTQGQQGQAVHENDRPRGDGGFVDFHQIVENDSDALVVFDREFRYRYVNAAAERQLQRRREEILGRGAWEEFPDAVGTPTYEAQTRAMRERVTLTYEAEYAPLGLHFEARVQPYDGPDGGGLIVCWHDITARVRAERERAAAVAEQERLLEELRQAASRQRRFLKEMLYNLTEGRLMLVDDDAELPGALTPFGIAPPLARPTLRDFRKLVETVAEKVGLPEERAHDLITAVGEAGLNAVTHAGGGEGRVHADPERATLQVWVTDSGAGIADERLHRATLEKGYTTAGTLGHGFWMMLRTVDRVYLLTGPAGTTVVLEQDREPAPPAWMREGLLGDALKALNL